MPSIISATNVRPSTLPTLWRFPRWRPLQDVDSFGDRDTVGRWPHPQLFTEWESSMKQACAYTVSVQSQPVRQGTRFHWLICGNQSPDELISWGYASTRGLAEAAAQAEVEDLTSGLTQGGQVTSKSETSTRRCLTIPRRFRRD